MRGGASVGCKGAPCLEHGLQRTPGCLARLLPSAHPQSRPAARRLAEALLEECVAHYVGAVLCFLRGVTEEEVAALARDDARIRAFFTQHVKPDKVGGAGAWGAQPGACQATLLMVGLTAWLPCQGHPHRCC